jgi:hypothetical protein
VLGKRRRDADDASSDDSDVPDDVKKIPMPRDTPPPIPKEVLDEWYAKRRAKRNAERGPAGEQQQQRQGQGQDRPEKREKPAAPAVEAKTVYEAKPILRDLQKEAVSAFVPAAVRVKIEKGKGRGGLLEPEEMDQLEKEGYLRAPEATQPQGAQPQPSQGPGPRGVTMEEVEDDED